MATPADARNQTSFFELVGYEAVAVLAIVAALVAFAIPAYASVTNRAQATAARTEVTASVAAIELYALAHGGYEDLTSEAIQEVDPGARVTVLAATSETYCIRDVDPAPPNYFKNGPSGVVGHSPCGET